MRKLLLFFTLFFISIYGYSQEVPEIPFENRLIQYEEILTSDAEKEALHSEVVKYIAEKYVSAQNVIQLNDKENGIIIAKGTLPVRYLAKLQVGSGETIVDANVTHTVKVDFKDNKYRVRLSDFEIVNTNGGANIPVEKVHKEILSFYQKEKPKKREIKAYETDLSFLIAFHDQLTGYFSSLENYVNSSLEDEW